jgi:O-Antigen ligase
MTNPASAMRMLITYAICIPVAIFVGYLLTNPLDYGSLGFIAIVAALLISPIFIKWHYPLLVFGLGCPAYCFFLPGNPPLWMVISLISLGLSMVERATWQRKFLSAPVAAWPLLFTVAMAYLTSKLTGGIGLHRGGSEGGGGYKYLFIFIGIASYFALTSRVIPKDKRNFFIALYVLSNLSGVLGEIGAILGGPFHALNLLFPGSSFLGAQDAAVGTTRLGSLARLFGAVYIYLLVRYGLPGIFDPGKPWRALIFLTDFTGSLLGGFRSAFAGTLLLVGVLFFLQKMYRSRVMPFLLLLLVLFIPVLALTSNHLPYVIQRSMVFLPFKWDPEVIWDTEQSTQWRVKMWSSLWPQVPEYLLLGKGYAMSAQDFEHIGNGAFAGLGQDVDASQITLAVSGDYHNGPLSTLIPFGIWGALSWLWLVAATTYVTYRNFRYGDEEIKNFNAFLFASTIVGVFGYCFIFGGYHEYVGWLAKTMGISIALNWGICRPAIAAAVSPRIKPLPLPSARPAPQLGRA